MNAYKWLAEMYALLCTDDSESQLYQPEFENALDSAVDLFEIKDSKNRRIMPSDSHLEYLITKLNCRVNIFNLSYCYFLTLMMLFF